MPRDRALTVLEAEALESIGEQEIGEVEAILADALFNAWIAERGAAVPTAEKVVVPA